MEEEKETGVRGVLCLDGGFLDDSAICMEKSELASSWVSVGSVGKNDAGDGMRLLLLPGEEDHTKLSGEKVVDICVTV